VRARPGCTIGEASARMEDSAAAADSGAERWLKRRWLRVEEVAGEVVSKGGSPAGEVRCSGWLGSGAVRTRT
jgi:hypothetical protein